MPQALCQRPVQFPCNGGRRDQPRRLRAWPKQGWTKFGRRCVERGLQIGDPVGKSEFAGVQGRLAALEVGDGQGQPGRERDAEE